MNTSPNGKPVWIETMQDRTLQTRPFDVCVSAASRNLASTGEEPQTLRGFGGCFNEIGWLPLQKPGREEQDRIVRELSSPDELNPVFTRNPDGTIVVVVQKALDRPMPFPFSSGAHGENSAQGFRVMLEPCSFNTFFLQIGDSNV